MTLPSASATGLRSTFAMPGRVSSNVEICEPPSSDTTRPPSPAGSFRAQGARDEFPEFSHGSSGGASSHVYYYAKICDRETGSPRRGLGGAIRCNRLSVLGLSYLIVRVPRMSYARCGRQKN